MQSVAGGEVKRIGFRLGLELHGEKSRSGLYAICKKKSGWALRITLFKELAESWRHPSREVRECYLTGVD